MTPAWPLTAVCLGHDALQECLKVNYDTFISRPWGHSAERSNAQVSLMSTPETTIGVTASPTTTPQQQSWEQQQTTCYALLLPAWVSLHPSYLVCNSTFSGQVPGPQYCTCVHYGPLQCHSPSSLPAPICTLSLSCCLCLRGARFP